ncbi:MAG: TonB-dependent receptor [Bacteroidota bacterium]
MPVFGQTTDSLSVPIDSVLARPDSLPGDSSDSAYVEGKPDSLERMSSPSLVGTYDRHLRSDQIITQEDKHWLDYKYLGNLLESKPGVFIRDQSSEGQYNQLTIRGMDWRSIAFTLDGRPLNDPASGIYNMYHFATEYADRIEFISGPRAFLYGLNSTGGAVNLVTKNYNSNRPLSRLNYSETGYNYSYTDGTFSQNISRKINVTLGFQHQGTSGRFENSAHEAWNARVKLRYNVSRDINIILSEYYTNTQTEMNGGVIPGISRFLQAFDPLQATMVNTDSYEKLNRHDVDLSFVGTLLGDTANVTMLTLYYSNNLREYRDEENRPNPNGIFIRSDHRSSWMGAQFTQNFDTELQRFNLGANLEIRQIEGSPSLGRRRNVIGSVWAKEEMSLGEMFTVAGFGRYDHYLKESHIGLGGDLTMSISEHIKLFGGISFSRRLPTYTELHWFGTIVDRAPDTTAEKHTLLEIGADVNLGDDFSSQVKYFHRHTNDALSVAALNVAHIFPALEFVHADKRTTQGVEIRAALKVWVLSIDGVASYLRRTESTGLHSENYPEFSGSGGIYYRNKLLNDNLDLKVGFKGRFLSSYKGERFNPEVLVYVPNSATALGGSSVDFVLMAHIGSAYITFIWENLTSAQYFITPYYPVLDREIRIGISWQFLD